MFFYKLPHLQSTSGTQWAKLRVKTEPVTAGVDTTVYEVSPAFVCTNFILDLAKKPFIYRTAATAVTVTGWLFYFFRTVVYTLKNEQLGH